MADQLFVHEYDRNDLDDEIGIILDVESKWLAWVDNTLPSLDNGLMYSGPRDKEVSIVNEIMKREELNPEGEKFVIL